MRLVLISFLFNLLYCSNAQVPGSGFPKANDSACIHDMQLAKMHADTGRIRCCVNATWDLPQARMYPVLDSICRLFGLLLHPEPGVERDVKNVNDPNTYTCYTDFMDRELEKKFGTGFKKRLLFMADSIYIETHANDPIPSYFCDSPPSYPKSKELLSKDFFSEWHFPPNCPLVRNCDFRVIFSVNVNGQAADYKFYYTDNIPINKECISKLKTQICKTLDKINHWNPGILGNHKVNSFGDLMVDLFQKEIW
jgi:hypothetical protein